MINHRLAGNSLWGHAWPSTRRILIGFSIASLIAVPLGLMMALNKYVNAIVKPIFDLMKPMPPLHGFPSPFTGGIGEPSKVFIIIIGNFVPCLLDAYNGGRLVEPELYDAVRVLGGNRRGEILQVCFPAAFPAIFAGLQISLSVALHSNPDISRVGCAYMQGIRAADVAVYLKALITQQVSAPARPGVRKSTRKQRVTFFIFEITELFTITRCNHILLLLLDRFFMKHPVNRQGLRLQ